MLIDKQVLTISELNGLIRDVIGMGFPSAVWLCGEIQQFDRNKNKKHIFFDLCEKDPATNEIVARIGLVIFANRKVFIDKVLKEAENAFQLKDDIEVKFLCKVDFYPPHGDLRLIVESIDPVYTLGKIAQEKQRLIALLKKQGTLDKNKQTVLPMVPLRIGLITAPDSAAYHDFLDELKAGGFGFKIYLRPALVQGKGAQEDICAAIGDLTRAGRLDAIVITRGGGSLAELSCFDSQAIAEKIAGCALPVLSGIGHEINVTITDLAAHTYQKTPTAIAQFLVQRVQHFMTDLQERRRSVLQSAQAQVAAEKRRLRDSALGLQSRTQQFLKEHHQAMVRYLEIIRRQPLLSLANGRQRLTAGKDLLLKTAEARLKNAAMQLQGARQLIEMADPVNTIKRGFSITRNQEGILIRSIDDIELEHLLLTQVSDGILASKLETVTPRDASLGSAGKKINEAGKKELPSI